MPGNAKRRRRKHRGTQTGSIDRRGRTRPRNREDAMNRARSQGKRQPDRRDSPPTWRGAIIRGGFFAVLLFPIAILFGQEIPAAAVLTVIAAFFYVPLGFYTDQFFYKRRMKKLEAERQAKKQARGRPKEG
jgi:hypothetical protein